MSAGRKSPVRVLLCGRRL